MVIDISLKDIIIIFTLNIIAFAVTIAMIQIFNSDERNKMRDDRLKEVRELRGEWQKERQDLLDRLMAKDLTEAKLAQKIGGNAERKVVSRSENTRRIIKENEKVGGSE